MAKMKTCTRAAEKSDQRRGGTIAASSRFSTSTRNLMS